MKRYYVNDLKPGMVVASPIFSNRGQLILDTDTVLTDHLISRLGFYGIYDAMIKDAPMAEPEPQPEAPAPKSASSNVEAIQSLSQKIKQKPEFQEFQINYTKEISSLQSSLSDILADTSQELNSDQLLNQVSNLSLDTKSSLDLFDMLHNMRQIDDSIYAHSLNVALIAKTLGNWLHFSENDLQILTLCGLLHDIGKTALPIELLNKPGKYTPEEYAAVKQHPVLGYQILREQPLDIRIKNAALMHHERCDGSGYPRKLKFEQLDDFSMIIAIADVYDAMTAARSYRKPLCPFQVIDAFEKEGLQKYHPKYILTFLEHIADTYQHNRVLLNTGQSATIVMINKQHLTKPYIQFNDNTTIDMASHKELEIVAIL